MYLIPKGMKEMDYYLTHTSGMFSSAHSTIFAVMLPDEITWHLDTCTQFFALYDQSIAADYHRASGPYEISIINFLNANQPFSMITVRAPQKSTIEKIFDIIERYREYSSVVLESQQPDAQVPPPTEPDNYREKRTCRRKPRAT